MSFGGETGTIFSYPRIDCLIFMADVCLNFVCPVFSKSRNLCKSFLSDNNSFITIFFSNGGDSYVILCYPNPVILVEPKNDIFVFGLRVVFLDFYVIAV